MVSASGVVLMVLLQSIPLRSFPGYDAALVSTIYGLSLGVSGVLIVWPWTRRGK
jgi:hypothetical protein